MAQLSINTISNIQQLLSDTFREAHPQPELSDEHVHFIRNHIMNYINEGDYNPYTMYRSFHSNVEDEYRSHLVLQPNGTILEMPSSWGSAMSNCRTFWMVFDRHIYQIETDLNITLSRMIVRRF